MNWRRGIILVSVGVVAYLVFLVLTLPAPLALGWLMPPQSQVRITAAEGTPWQGQADQLIVAGSPLGHVSWDMRPWALLAGKISYALRVKGAVTHLAGEVVMSSSGKLVVSDVNGPLALNAALPWLDLPLPRGAVSGRLHLSIKKLVVENRQPTTLTGRVSLKRLHTSWPGSMELGAYVATLNTDDDGLHGRAHDSGGPIDLDATADVSRNGHYQVKGTMTPRAGTPSTLKQGLGFLGRTDDNGTTHFSFRGQLSKL